jgi:hypothetical protein
MLKWEYKIVHRVRGVQEEKTGAWDVPISEQLRTLGQEGWELVAVTPRSTDARPGHGGVTTEEQWIFKRPLPLGDA